MLKFINKIKNNVVLLPLTIAIILTILLFIYILWSNRKNKTEEEKKEIESINGIIVEKKKLSTITKLVYMFVMSFISIFGGIYLYHYFMDKDQRTNPVQLFKGGLKTEEELIGGSQELSIPESSATELTNTMKDMNIISTTLLDNSEYSDNTNKSRTNKSNKKNRNKYSDLEIGIDNFD